MKVFVFSAIFISFIDLFTQLPIMSPFAQSLGAGPLLMGIIVGMYSLSNMVGNVIGGGWVDRFGAKRVLTVSLAVTAVLIAAYAFVQSPWQLVVVRFLHGMSAGFIVPSAFTLVARRAKKGRQGRTMALSGASVGIAAIIGPAFSGIVKSRYGPEPVFLTVATLMLLVAVIAVVILRKQADAPAEADSAGEAEAAGARVSDYVALLRHKELLTSYIGSFTLMFSQGVLAYMLPLKIEGLGFNSSLSGTLLSTFGIVAIAFFVLPTNRMFDRVDNRRTMLIGIMIMGASLGLLALFNERSALYVIMCIYGTGFALLFPSINAILVRNVTDLNRGKAFGLFYAFFSLGVVAGSLVVGAVGGGPNVGFGVGAVVIYLLVLSIVFFLRRTSASEPIGSSPEA